VPFAGQSVQSQTVRRHRREQQGLVERRVRLDGAMQGASRSEQEAADACCLGSSGEATVAWELMS
jgi:hypothetical protein